MEQFEELMNNDDGNIFIFISKIQLFVISSLQTTVQSMKETFVIDSRIDDSGDSSMLLSDKVLTVLIQLFSNIFSLPIIFLLVFLFGQVTSYYQAKRTKFYYQPTNKLYQELMKNSKLTQMRYRPWTFAFNAHWQAFLFPAVEMAHQYLNKQKLKNEVFTLSDGGCIMLDWYLNPAVPTPDLSSPSFKKTHESQQPRAHTTMGYLAQRDSWMTQSTAMTSSNSGFKSQSSKNLSFQMYDQQDDQQIDEQYIRVNPLIIIVPGLTGDSKNLYSISTIKEAEKYGYDCVVVNYRCQAGLKPTSPHIYHAGNCTDLKEAIDWIKDMRSESIMFGVGISLGAGILANYVAKAKYDCPLKAAVSIGCHYDSDISLKHMSSYWFGLYDYILGYYCRMMNQETIKVIDALNSKTNPDRIIGDELSKIYQLTHFIERIITKIEGIKSWQEYVLESSCTHRLQDIKIPLFFLSAHDDPVFGNKCIPIDKCHENILIGVTKAGGHLGYFEGAFLPHKQWFPEPTFEFINQIYNSTCKNSYESDQESTKSINFPEIRLKRENSLKLTRRTATGADKHFDIFMD
eukprot:403361706